MDFNIRFRRVIESLACAIFASLLVSGCATIKDGPVAGQEIVFFPSTAAMSERGQWSLSVQGRVFDPTEQSASRQALISVLAPVIGVNADDIEQTKLFRQRAGYFLSDSHRNVRISVRIGDETFVLPASNPAGYFSAEIGLAPEQVERLAQAGTIAFESVATASNPNRFAGYSVLVPETGVTVVSDVDDTIKITNILSHREKIERTFLLPFTAVPGMPELYGSWQTAFAPRIHFHVVSAGPWQFNVPLRQFTEAAAYPAFTWTMRSVDIGDPIVLLKELDANPYDFKVKAIRDLMQRFPKRHVVLVGDSGEKDPEVYATIAAEFGDRIDAVYIRNVTSEDCAAPRYREFSRPNTPTRLSVFKYPRELPALSPSLPFMALCAR